jgi:hypothetical protein
VVDYGMALDLPRDFHYDSVYQLKTGISDSAMTGPQRLGRVPGRRSRMAVARRSGSIGSVGRWSADQIRAKMAVLSDIDDGPIAQNQRAAPESAMLVPLAAAKPVAAATHSTD